MQPPPFALSTSAPLRYATFGALYLVQGIPQGLQLFAIPAWLAMNGKDATTVGGYVAICTLPWTFKLVVGPLMDRYSFLAMGRRRPWLLTAQFGLLVMMLVMACVPDPLNNMSLFMAVSFVVNCFGAVQDVATDGLAVDITPEDQQARTNGVMWGAKVVGIGATVTLGTWAINTYGFALAVVGLVALMLVLLVLPSLLRERPGERLFPWSVGQPSPETLGMKAETWGEILYTIRSAFFLRNSLLGALCIFIGAFVGGLKDAQLPVFTIQQLGWDNGAYANLVAGANVAAAVLAMVVAGWLADRVGKVRIISIYFAVMIAGWLALSATTTYWADSSYITAFVYVGQVLETFSQVAILATAMNLSWARVAATQFTLYMVSNNIGYALGASMLGMLRTHLDWSGMFLCSAGVLLLALVLWQFMRLGNHREALGKLEKDFLHRSGKGSGPHDTGIMDLGVPLPP